MGIEKRKKKNWEETHQNGQLSLVDNGNYFWMVRDG